MDASIQIVFHFIPLTNGNLMIQKKNLYIVSLLWDTSPNFGIHFLFREQQYNSPKGKNVKDKIMSNILLGVAVRDP